jgi:hypothetical protein
MNDPKSTNDIRLIAQDVTNQRGELCDARRENLQTQLEAVAETAKANTDNITSLTLAVTSLTATVTPVVTTVKENSSAIEKLKGRPAAWAAIGAATPTLLGVALWWFSK